MYQSCSLEQRCSQRQGKLANRWIKDPDEVLQYIFDWAPLANGNGDSNWLDQTASPKEIISSQTTTNVDSPGLTIVASSITDSSTSVTVKLSGGTVGQKYRILNQIITNTGQTAERTVTVHIKSR